MMRAGDTVLHKPTGEEWVLAATKGEYVAPAGWPACRALATDCEVIEAASDEEHASILRQVAAHSGSDFRAEWARQEYEARHDA